MALSPTSNLTLLGAVPHPAGRTHFQIFQWHFDIAMDAACFCLGPGMCFFCLIVGRLLLRLVAFTRLFRLITGMLFPLAAFLSILNQEVTYNCRKNARQGKNL